MTYTQGGLIEATDYNTLVGSNTSITSTQLNAVWAWGANSRGYGQTAVSQVSALSTVTATQWASLVNTVNSANTHITGSGSGLTANTAGQIIGFSGGLQTKINGINSDRLLFASNAAATVNVSGLAAYGAWTSTSTASTLSRAFGLRATFSNGADAARFFFNAGGRMKFNITATADAVARSVAAKAVIDNLGGIALFAANTNGGRTGAGGTLGTNNTALGYYTSPFNANTVAFSITSTTASYTSDTGTLSVKPGGSQGSFNGNGSTIEFWADITSTAGTGAVSVNDSLSVTVTVTLDVSWPETTNISNTWGAVVVTQL